MKQNFVYIIKFCFIYVLLINQNNVSINWKINVNTVSDTVFTFFGEDFWGV